MSNQYDAYNNPGANQTIDGIPRHTPWDIYAEAHNPLDTRDYTLNTQDAYGGMGFTDFAEEYNFIAPERLITWRFDQQYQGIAPMDLQPILQAPKPWE